MTTPADIQSIVPDLTRTARAVGQLAQDETLFRAWIDAYRAQDGDSFQRLLSQFNLTEECDLLCRWIGVKESVLRCLSFCGSLPQEPLTVADIPRFATAISRITSDEELIETLAESIQEGDVDEFRNLVRQVGAERYCHLICYWASIVYSRLICKQICATVPPPRRHFVAELAVAGGAISSLVKRPDLLDQVIKAGIANNCEILNGLLTPDGHCFVICEWVCSWHCVLNCLQFCTSLPNSNDVSILEIRAFALALSRVAATEGAIARLATAMATGNTESYSALVREFELQRFCTQLCHWLCFEFCRLFCFCVCPEPEVIPLFTKVGIYRVDPIWGDFTSDGTTTAGGYAFTSTIPLIGIIPDGSTPTPVEYRFLWEKYPLGSGAVPVTPAMIADTVIGELEYIYWDGTAPAIGAADFYASNTPMTISIPQQFGPPLTVNVNTPIAPDGWIAVPRLNSLFLGGVGRFIGGANNQLVDLKTTMLTNEVFDLTSAVPPLPVLAGDSVPLAQRSEKPQFKITFEARNAVTHMAIGTNFRDRIALSNTTYTYLRHPDWAGGNVTTTPVVSLDVAELKTGGGCNPLKVGSHLHALFTAYHPYLGTCEVFVQGPGVPPPAPINPPIVSGQAQSPIGGQDIDSSTLKPCAYVLWLSTTLKLTVGYGQIPGEFDDLIAFCID
jgi:hypothetical protein